MVTRSPASFSMARRRSALTRQPVRAVTLRHEGAGERVAIDRAAHLHQAAGAEVCGRLRPHDVGPPALVRAFLQSCRECLVDAGVADHRLGMDGVEFREVSFGHTRKTPILDRFTLTVDAGDCVALVGASGAGKTTVLKLVNRLLVPDAGDVRVEGTGHARVGSDPAAALRRLRDPGRRPVSAPDRRRQHRGGAAARRLGRRAGGGPRARAARAGRARARRLRRPLARRAVGRAAPARRRRARARRGSAGAADGRAVRRARSGHARGSSRTSSAASSRGCARPSSSSPTTWAKRWRWPTASASSTQGRLIWSRPGRRHPRVPTIARVRQLLDAVTVAPRERDGAAQ